MLNRLLSKPSILHEIEARDRWGTQCTGCIWVPEPVSQQWDRAKDTGFERSL